MSSENVVAYRYVARPDEDITKRFTHHPPTGDQAERYVELRNTASKIALDIIGYCPPSRERSLALTHLEETIFWANASIARNE